ncbi:MAG: hypothetical protein KC449_28915, partial [Anaerolineales bacterium]|nr:hypothetical protein [Anaerolineales bacterium]
MGKKKKKKVEKQKSRPPGLKPNQYTQHVNHYHCRRKTKIPLAGHISPEILEFPGKWRSPSHLVPPSPPHQALLRIAHLVT